jgi:hypothetical protein
MLAVRAWPGLGLRPASVADLYVHVSRPWGHLDRDGKGSVTLA